MRVWLSRLDYKRETIPLTSAQYGNVSVDVVVTGRVDMNIIANLILSDEELSGAGFKSMDDMHERIARAIEKAFEPTGERTAPGVIVKLDRRRRRIIL